MRQMTPIRFTHGEDFAGEQQEAFEKIVLGTFEISQQLVMRLTRL